MDYNENFKIENALSIEAYRNPDICISTVHVRNCYGQRFFLAKFLGTQICIMYVIVIKFLGKCNLMLQITGIRTPI